MNAFANVLPASRRARTRRASIIGCLLAAVALFATSCDSGAAWVAKVNGDVVDAPNFWAGVPHFVAYSAIVSGSAPPTTTIADVHESAAAANYAMFLVQVHALETLNERHSTPVTKAQLTEVRQALEASAVASQLKDVPDWVLDQLVRAQANYQALADYYGKGKDPEAQIKAYYEANKGQFRQICMDVIGGADEAELAAARQQIDGGADFATVAKAVAAQQPAGQDGQAAQALGEKADGNVGCVPMSTVTQLFADPSGAEVLAAAKPNTLVGPVPVAGGAFMLFRVQSTSVQPLAEVHDTIQQTIGQPGQQQAQQALNDYLDKAKIQLNPRLGAWTKGVGYTPPVGAEQPAGSDALPFGLSAG